MRKVGPARARGETWVLAWQDMTHCCLVWRWKTLDWANGSIHRLRKVIANVSHGEGSFLGDVNTEVKRLIFRIEGCAMV